MMKNLLVNTNFAYVYRSVVTKNNVEEKLNIIYRGSLVSHAYLEQKKIKNIFCQEEDFEYIHKVLKGIYGENCKTLTLDKRFYSIVGGKKGQKKILVRNIGNFFDQNMCTFFRDLWKLDYHATIYQLLRFFEDILYEDLKNTSIYDTKVLSMTSAAYYLFRKSPFTPSYIHYTIHEHLYDNLRKAFFGGRTEIFRHTYKYKKECFIYDFKSYYPSLMKENYYPTGSVTLIDLKDSSYSVSDCETYIKNYFGFAEIVFSYPKNKKLPVIPVLPQRNHEGKLIFAQGERISGIYFSEEIRLAEAQGYLIEYHRLYTYRKGKIFTKFIDHFAAKQNISKGHKKILKLFLNRLYGSFCISKENNLKRGSLKNLNELTQEEFDQFQGEIDLDNDNMDNVAFIEVPLKNRNFRNIAIAAAITSYGRMKLYNYLNEYKNSIIYCDTDSVVSLNPINISTSLDIGSLQLVNEEPIIDFVFISAKFYCLLYKSGKEKLVIKGFQSSDLQWTFAQIKQDFLNATKNGLDFINLRFKSPTAYGNHYKFQINDKNDIVITNDEVLTKPLTI